jgi:zinc transport system substrate-binding protein
VLTSIRPLQLIASEILQGVGTADVLLDPQQSPHHFQLKPSQLRKLQQADLLVWISDDFETGLARLKQSLPADATRLQLMPLLAEDGSAPERQAAAMADSGEHDHDANAHLWLSPRQDARIATLIARELSRLDPAHAGTYEQNRDRLIRRLQRWTGEARQRLSRAQPRYLLDHPFLEGFEHELGIHAIGTLADANARSGSLKRLHRLQQRLRKRPADCLFSADWPADRRSRQFARQFKLKLQWLPILDPEQHADSIVDLLDRLASRILDCRPSG